MTIDTYPTTQTHSSARRRRFLRVTAGSAAALAGVVLAGRNSGIAQANNDQALVGSWLVAATPPGAPSAPARLLVSFTSDGIAIRTAPLQQVAPPALGAEKMFISTTHGVWAPNGDGTFGLTFAGFAFDDTGKFLAVQHIRVAAQVNDSQDGFSGPFKTEFVGADGQVLASSSGSVEGTRMQVEGLG